MSYDVIKIHQKELETSLKSQFAVFALTNSSEDIKSLNKSVEALAKTLQFMNDLYIETEADSTLDSMSIRFDKNNKKEYDMAYFKPHVMTGHSPFMLQIDGKKVVGVLVKLQYKNVSYCNKTIKRLVRQRFEESMRNDELLTMKECKRLIETELKEGKNKEPVPLVDRYQDHYFYIDIKNQIVLAKNAHRSKDVINMFFSLLIKAGKAFQDEHPEVKAELDALLTEAMKERMDIVPYSTYALTHEKAFGAYSIHDTVVHYSQEETDKDSKPIPFLPTDTAGFGSDKTTNAKVDFKNSVGYFLGHDEKAMPSYRTLSSLSEKHRLRALSLRVTGEVPLTEQLKRYKEAHPDAFGDDIAGDYLTMTFDTRASDGNVIFKFVEGLYWPMEATRRLLQDKFDDTHIGKKQLEPFLLNEFGASLELLHHSCSMFIDFYLRANQASGEFEETALERDLKQAQADANEPLESKPEPENNEQAA